MQRTKLNDKTIVFYISSLAKGGAERCLVNLANLYANKGWKVTILTHFKESEEYSDVDSRIERIVLPDHFSGMSIQRVIKRIKNLRSEILKVSPVCMVTFMRKNNLRAVLATRHSGIRLILSVRSTPEREYPGKVMKFLARRLFGKADGVVFQTEDAAEFFPVKVRKKSKVIMNSVKKEFLIPRYEGVRKKEIVTVGRLNRVKNHELIVRAFDAVKDEFPGYVVKIYGGGENENLKNLIAERKLENRVLLMGNTDDVISSIKESSLFILSSDAEGMPNALIEAMSLGLPCISTDCPCGGPRMIIRNGENGILIPVGDCEKLADSIRRVLSDSKFADSIGKEAILIHDRISPDAVNCEWMNYIEGVDVC